MNFLLWPVLSGLEEATGYPVIVPAGFYLRLTLGISDFRQFQSRWKSIAFYLRKPTGTKFFLKSSFLGLGTGSSSLGLVGGVDFEGKLVKVRFDRNGLVRVSKCLGVIGMVLRERGLERMVSARV